MYLISTTHINHIEGADKYGSSSTEKLRRAVFEKPITFCFFGYNTAPTLLMFAVMIHANKVRVMQH